MKRIKTYKLIIFLAIIIAGGICLLLPEKKVTPTASVKGAVEKVVMDTTNVEVMNVNK